MADLSRDLRLSRRPAKTSDSDQARASARQGSEAEYGTVTQAERDILSGLLVADREA